jgi:uncharacterized protein YndB with AHSA1/START domain
MKWLLIVVVGLAVIAAAIVIVGLLLPRGHFASRSATFGVSPERIWQAITDVEAFPSWRAGVKSVKTLPDRQGQKAWIEETSTGPIPLVVERSEAPRLLVVRIADANLPFGGTWTYQIAPAGTRSTLTITENGEIYNPLFRFVTRFVSGYEATLASYLSSLEKRLARPS